MRVAPACGQPMSRLPPAPQRPDPSCRRLWAALGGAVIGFAIAAVFYVQVTPALEACAGWVRELQGLSWNLVPGLTVLGAITGWVLAGRVRGD